MARQETFFLIEVLNYKPVNVGFALSAKDGWFVGKYRFCGLGKAREFPTEESAQDYIDNRYDGDRYEFEIVPVIRWVA